MQKIIIILLATLAATQANVIKRSAEVSNGALTNIELYPYQVSVRVYGAHSCIGTIVSENVVITSALCIYLFSPAAYSIQYGVTTIGGSENVITAELLVKNQHFNPITFDNNIGVIILSDNIPLSSVSKTIALAKSVPAAGTDATLTGWGILANATALEMIDIQIISNTECAAKYTGLNQITDSVLCAGVAGQMDQACVGDGGAPLVINNELVGILSFGDNCGSTNDPAVFTSIPSALDWLNNELNDIDVMTNVV